MLAENYKRLEENILSSCAQAHRKREDITLVAVSKFHTAEKVAQLAILGHKHFSENYFKEAKEKRKNLEALISPELYNSLYWHSTGHIQTNKAKDACDNYYLLHTVDSERLASALNKILEQRTQKQNILLEINIASEQQKNGVLPVDCPRLIEQILTLSQLNIQGFMCLPPMQRKEGENRKHFNSLYELKCSMEKLFSTSFPHLSMGTSADYKEAILEGATFIRIGTDIFGQREY